MKKAKVYSRHDSLTGGRGRRRERTPRCGCLRERVPESPGEPRFNLVNAEGHKRPCTLYDRFSQRWPLECYVVPGRRKRGGKRHGP
jgi:hypothetical protein